MARIYDKPVRELMRDILTALGIRPDQVFTRNQVRSWFSHNYPLIKEGTIAAHLLRLSINAPSRVHYNPKPGEDDVFFQLDSSRFRLYSSQNDPKPIGQSPENEASEFELEEEETNLNKFAYEKDLQNFLSKNLHLIEPGLNLFEDEVIKGIEFPVGGRFIDILAIDKNSDWVVIELKVSKGYDRVVGQLLRYMAWIKQHHAKSTQKVRGLIVARSISEDLLLACSDQSNIQLFEYELSVNLTKVSS